MSTTLQLNSNGPNPPIPPQTTPPDMSRSRISSSSSSPQPSSAPISTLASETSNNNTGGLQQRPSRRVARRACLSCREKKIKCDGEPVCAISSADGINKVVPEKTRICSNCKFLGIECVFVQSNRGGRRKRKDGNTEGGSQTDGSIDSAAQAKKIRTDSSSNTATFTNTNNSGISANDYQSIQNSTARVSSFILGSKGTPSIPIPASIQSTPLSKMPPPPISSAGRSQNVEQITSKTPYPEFDEMARSDTTRSNSYDFPRFPFASRPGGGRRYEDIDRPDGTETESSFRLSSMPSKRGPGRKGEGSEPPSPRDYGRGPRHRG